MANDVRGARIDNLGPDPLDLTNLVEEVSLKIIGFGPEFINFFPKISTMNLVKYLRNHRTFNKLLVTTTRRKILIYRRKIIYSFYYSLNHSLTEDIIDSVLTYFPPEDSDPLLN